MSIFEIEGSATRKVACDSSCITITFHATGTNSYEVSQKVMRECDGFLEEIKKMGFDTKYIRYEGDSVSDDYCEQESKSAERSISIRIPFDMERINQIQNILQEGRYEYELKVVNSISNRREIRTELAKEALLNLKNEAEQIAETLGVNVIGVESISKDDWNGAISIFENLKGDEQFFTSKKRASDDLGAETKEEIVSLKVKWILE